MSSNTVPTEPTMTTTNGSDLPAVPAPLDGGTHPTDDEFDVGLALLRLLLGGTLVGADQLRDRLRRWEEVSRPTPTDRAQTQAAASPHTTAPSLRHALIGIAFAAETRMRQGFSTMRARAARLTDDANLAYTRLTLSARGTPLDVVRVRLDELLFAALTEVDRWTAQGSRAEQQARRMAEQAVGSVVDELFDSMARNPEVRHLIEQQGASMAGTAVGDVRERTASADLWIERLAHSVLRRPMHDHRGDQAAHAGATAPVVKRPTVAAGAEVPD